MTEIDIAFAATSPFEAIKRTDERGEYWMARDLMPIMGYGADWRNFDAAISRATATAGNTGEDPARVFVGVTENSGGRPRADVRMSRYGAYLIAMNGDPRKPEVAQAQQYFAIQTRRAEVAVETSVAQIPADYPAALRFAAEQYERAQIAEHRAAELEPAAAQAEHFRKADGLTAIADFCNDLALWAREQHGIKRLRHADIRDFLAEVGLVIRGNTVRNNQPTADAMTRGLIRTHHITYDTNTRGPQEATSARLTPKGWGYAWDRATARIAEHGSLETPKTIERSAA